MVHFLHILAGVLWGGGTYVFALLVFPAMARQPAAEAGRLWHLMAPMTGPVMAASAGIAMVFGLWRASQALTSFDSLFLTGYGWAVIASVVLWGALGATGARFRKALVALMEDPARYSADAPSLARRAGLVDCALMTLLIGLMALMGLAVV
ncbi:CopD family protein [Roseisalinus antarcticus]|uniref:Copper resistance protein D n=1 Tax=Roseisalinus antarcticus TaxID=254357 RepID=A0A1Y5S1L5_9RHOB|nr:hypothetical protein [Roseisalinus antarcticus]SLN27869.1 hypothetical protein ROA7023_00912 [Roseisalinus antarcticus]